MTLPKGETRKSEARPYSYIKGSKTAQRFHNMPHLEVNHWFRLWGVIGEKRDRRPNT